MSVTTIRVFWLVLLLAMPALILLLDWAVYNLAGNDATLSRMLLNVQSRWPLLAICFAFDAGIIVSHLFLAQTIVVQK